MTQIHVLILNYNGRSLLAECLPSVVEAAGRSGHACEVVVIDNESTDDSLAYLQAQWPEVRIVRRENRGLCSYNGVIPELPGPVAVLLNNDIKLARDAVDPLVAPLLDEPACFMTAPLCWLFDGQTYEGFRTAVRWRFGLVQATALFEGHEPARLEAGPTASAGAAMAVDCRKFAQLQGFDPVYLPGRVEDLDLAFRARMAGYQIRFVPQSVVFHGGMSTFGREFGQSGCDQLALRNTLLFQWKNLRHPRHVLRQLTGLPLRLARDVARIPWAPRQRRGEFCRALAGALVRLPRIRWNDRLRTPTMRKEIDFFRRFHPRGMTGRTSANNGEEVEVGHVSNVPVFPRGFGTLETCPTCLSSIHMNDSPTITAAIIARNEADNLAALLPRLDWVDEIVVVVDDGSTDATYAVAAALGARVVRRPFDTFARQRNRALAMAGGEWVLSIDADERPTPGMVAEIRHLISVPGHAAFRVPIRSTIFGRAFRRSGTQDDRPIRLFRRRGARWTGDVHEILRAPGRVGRLTRGLEHRTLADRSAFQQKMDRYTALEAEARVAAGHAPRRLDGWMVPAREVFRRLIWKQGFLDGPAGWRFCLLSGLSERVLAVRHRRLWEAARRPKR